MDYYYEQNVGNEKIEKNTLKYLILRIVRYFIVAIGIILFFIMMTVSPAENLLLQLAFILGFYLLMMSPLVLTFILLGRYMRRSASEYDYLINGELFRIVRVIMRKKRKLFLESKLSAIESMGKADSDGFDKAESIPRIKKLMAITTNDIEKVFYAVMNHEGGEILLIFQPDEEFINTLRKAAPRLFTFNKGFK